MKFYFTGTQQTVHASSAKKLVEWMRLHDLEESANTKDFMEKYALREFTFEKKVLSTTNEDKFVKSMIKNGVLKKRRLWFSN